MQCRRGDADSEHRPSQPPDLDLIGQQKPRLHAYRFQNFWQRCELPKPGGDHIGNGTPDDPMGRCNTLLAVRRALDLVPGIEGATAISSASSPALTTEH